MFRSKFARAWSRMVRHIRDVLLVVLLLPLLFGFLVTYWIFDGLNKRKH